MRGSGPVLLVLLLALGVVARVVGLAERPIWHDEVYTRIFAAGHQSHDWIDALYVGRPVAQADIVAFQALAPGHDAFDTVRGLAVDEPQHPPAYYLLARVWMGLFGDSLAALRALSVLASLAAIGLAWWLAREVFRADAAPDAPSAPVDESAERRARGVLVALAAVSPFLVVYAQEAREYALWAACILASTAALARALRLGTPGSWVAYALVSALGLYTAFAHATVLAVQAAWVGWVGLGRWRRERVFPRAWAWMAAALLVAGLLFLPWAWLLGDHLEAFQASMDWSRAIVVPPGEVLTALAANASRPFVELGDNDGARIGPFGWALVAAAVTLVAWALVRWWRRGPRAARVGIGLLFALPILFLLVPDLAFGGIRSLSARYLIPAWLAALVMVAWSLGTLAGRRGQLLRALVVGAAAASTLGALGASVPWSRALSAGLPNVAHAIDAAERPLVIGDRERHHPGNLLALATMVKPETEFVLLDFPARDALLARAEDEARAGHARWPPAGLPSGRALFVYAPIPQLLAALEAAMGRKASLVWRDQHVECWRL